MLIKLNGKNNISC